MSERNVRSGKDYTEGNVDGGGDGASAIGKDIGQSQQRNEGGFNVYVDRENRVRRQMQSEPHSVEDNVERLLRVIDGDPASDTVGIRTRIREIDARTRVLMTVTIIQSIFIIAELIVIFMMMNEAL